VIIKVTDEEFNLLRDIIQKKSGIHLGDNKKYLIENRLSLLASKAQCTTFGEFARKLNYGFKSKDLEEKVIEAITTKETYWFRDFSPFEHLKEVFFPLMAEEILSGKRDHIRIWSAASSTGQEPYSIAMTALEFQRKFRLTKPIDQYLSLLATDISQKALTKAEQGVYNYNELRRGLPEEYIRRYFKEKGADWILSEKVRSLVEFAVYNLQHPVPVKWKDFDLIMLRNVMIYFSDAFKKSILEKIAKKLGPDGILYLGTGETVSGYSNKFQVLDYKKVKYYKIKPQ